MVWICKKQQNIESLWNIYLGRRKKSGGGPDLVPIVDWGKAELLNPYFTFVFMRRVVFRLVDGTHGWSPDGWERPGYFKLVHSFRPRGIISLDIKRICRYECEATIYNLGGTLKYKKGNRRKEIIFKMEANTDFGNHWLGSWTPFTSKIQAVLAM